MDDFGFQSLTMGFWMILVFSHQPWGSGLFGFSVINHGVLDDFGFQSSTMGFWMILVFSHQPWGSG